MNRAKIASAIRKIAYLVLGFQGVPRAKDSATTRP